LSPKKNRGETNPVGAEAGRSIRSAISLTKI